MSFTPQFQVGDQITKRNGKKVAVVENIPNYSGGYYHCRYVGSGQTFYAYGTDLKIADQDEQSQNMKTLYSYTKEDGSTGYGTHIGTNSQNQYLIEEKGSGAILVFDKDKLEEVLPYTFSAKIGNSETHYQGTKGSVEVDDVLLFTGGGGLQIAVVSALDTKNKNARGKFKGVKLVTQKI